MLFSVIALAVAGITVLIIVGNRAMQVRDGQKRVKEFQDDMQKVLERATEQTQQIQAKLDHITQQLDELSRQERA